MQTTRWRELEQHTYRVYQSLWYVNIKLLILHVNCYFMTGPPSEPGDLSSESVSDGVLVFSWSPPWAPDGVQLNYTVTVTNTNTSVVTVFNTSDTNITLTRDNITSVNLSSSSSSSQCDHYMWSVTAVNPAGISVPANHTTAVSLISSTIIV